MKYLPAVALSPLAYAIVAKIRYRQLIRLRLAIAKRTI